LLITAAILQNPDNISQDYYLVIEIVAYVLLAPTIFFLPLLGGHRAMLAYRNRLLAEISTEFSAAISQLRTTRSEDADKAEPLIKKIRQLKDEHELVDRFPTWPFSSASLRKFLSLVASPLIPSVISLVLRAVFKI